jgi:hypothetical protein
MNMNTMELNVSQEEIARRAYELWQSRGCPPGDGSQDWQAAEAELIERRFSRDSAAGRGFASWWRRVLQKTQQSETNA